MDLPHARPDTKHQRSLIKVQMKIIMQQQLNTMGSSPFTQRYGKHTDKACKPCVLARHDSRLMPMMSEYSVCALLCDAEEDCGPSRQKMTEKPPFLHRWAF